MIGGFLKENLSLELNSNWYPAAWPSMFTPFIFREQALRQVRQNDYELVLELFPLVRDTTISLPERRAVARRGLRVRLR